jgi:segregation and condensation protein B
MPELSPADVSQRPLECVPEAQRAALLGALLHVASEPVSVQTLAQQLGCTIEECRDALEVLESRLDGVGLLLQRAGQDDVQISTAPRFAHALQRFLGLERTTRLSPAALETLAIIAYRGPVTRGEIERVRGVDSSGVLQTLLARGLIEPVGRQTAIGSPLLYATTPEFLRFFGLTSLHDLPPLPDDLTVALEESDEQPEASG